MPVGDIFVEKLKATQFFHPDRLPVLRDAVHLVHRLTSLATLFIKSYYLEVYLPTRSSTTPPLVLDKQFIARVLALVKRGAILTRGTCPPAIALQNARLVAHYTSHPFFSHDLSTNRAWYSSRSLSHVFGYSEEQLETGYTNNIILHYSSYVRRFVLTSLRTLAGYDDLAEPERRRVDADAHRAVSDVFGCRGLPAAFFTCQRPDFREWLSLWRGHLVPPPKHLPDGRLVDVDDHLEACPFDFLPYMVRINGWLEDAPAGQPDRKNKIYSPLILRRSFVPTHMRLDTAAILDIFVDDVAQFKAWYGAAYGQDLRIDSKAGLTGKLETLLGRPVTAAEAARHADRCWEYVLREGRLPARLQNRERVLKKRRSVSAAAVPTPASSSGASTSSGASSSGASSSAGAERKAEAARRKASASITDPDDYALQGLRFQRIVETDGYNVSALLTSAADARGKVVGSRSGRPSPLPDLNPDTAGIFGHYLDPSRYKVVGCDPGKKDVVRMGDGTTSLRYTQARRERECRFLWNRRHQETKKRLRRFPGLILLVPPPRGQQGPAWQLPSPSVEEIETRFLREHSARSSRPEVFSEYLTARREVDPHLTPFYQGAYFRSSKYSIYLATKSSQDRFVDRIRNAFGGGTANGRADGGRAVVVAWGNWGRLPNALRNSGPTPGVGFRRFVHRRLASDRRPSGEVFRGNTVTVFEGMTSSICNACGRRVENAVMGGERQHRLLECRGEGGCGRRWNRDELGYRNILREGLHLLRHGMRDPWFVYRQ
jgi:hypothetical protein